MALGSAYIASEAVLQRAFWVYWFHNTPHINLTLARVNDTFAPDQPVYQESLGIIGSVPAAILILTLLFLLIYLLTRCCDNKPRKHGSIICLKVTCVLFSLFTLGSLGVSIWGNEEVHSGVTSAVHSLGTINSMVQSLTNKTKIFDETIRHNLQPQLTLFKEKIQQHEIKNFSAKIHIVSLLNEMQSNISEVLLINVEDIRNELSRADLSRVVRTLGLGELVRWISTIAITGLLMIIVLIVPIGVARHSRCNLITFSVLGLISLILCWGLTSLYLVSTVALSDWCLDPNPFLETQMTPLMSKEVATYYLRCEATRQSPFTDYLTFAQRAANRVLENLNKVAIVADANYQRTVIHPPLDHIEAYVNQSQRTLGNVAALLECQSLHQQYLNAFSATCSQAVSGLVYLLLSAAGSGILFTFLVWFTSHTWIYLNHKRGPHSRNSYYQRPGSRRPTPGRRHVVWTEMSSCEEREQFLPGRGSRGGTLTSLGYSRPRNSHTPPQTPPFPGTLNGRSNYHSDAASLGGGPSTLVGPGNGSSVGTLGSQGVPVGGSSAVSTMTRDNHHGHNHHHGHHNNHHHGGHHHHHGHHSHPSGPNQGQYATLSKQCKTLESSDFY